MFAVRNRARGSFVDSSDNYQVVKLTGRYEEPASGLENFAGIPMKNTQN